MGIKLAERYQWLPKDLYHRKSLDKLKEGDLKQAAEYNRIALQKKPDFEKALVLKDIIAMKRDISLNRLDQKIQYHENILIALMQRQEKIEKSIKNQKWYSFFSFFISVVFILSFLTAGALTLIKLKFQTNLHWFWPIMCILTSLGSGYVFSRLTGFKLNRDLNHLEYLSILNALKNEIRQHSDQLHHLKSRLEDLENLI